MEKVRAKLIHSKTLHLLLGYGISQNFSFGFCYAQKFFYFQGKERIVGGYFKQGLFFLSVFMVLGFLPNNSINLAMYVLQVLSLSRILYLGTMYMSLDKKIPSIPEFQSIFPFNTAY